MGSAVKRDEVWLAEVDQKKRPVLLLTRSEVLNACSLATVAGVTTSIRGLAAEVDINHIEVGLDRLLVINCDGLHTVVHAALTGPIGQVDDDTMGRACSAIGYVLGC